MKKLLIFAAMLALASAAFAGSISRGGSSFSRSSSFSSSPSRSLGMSRPSVTPSYSRPAGSSYSPPRPATSPSSYNAPAPTVVNNHSGGGGGGFLSSFAGGAAGALVGNALTSNHGGATVVNAGGGVAPVIAPAGGAYQAVGVGQGGTSIAGFLAQLLLCLTLVGLIAFLVWFAVRIFKSAKQRAAQDADYAKGYTPMPFSPVGFFMDVQAAFAGCDEPMLRKLLGPDMLHQMLADMPVTASKPTLVGISYDVLDIRSEVVSIHYRATDTEDGSKLSETWHIVRHNGAWVLNGIDQ